MVLIPSAVISVSYFLSIICCRAVSDSFFKKCAKHIDIKSFTKTAWSCEKRNHRALVNKVLNHHCLVNIVIFRGCQTVIGAILNLHQIERIVIVLNIIAELTADEIAFQNQSVLKTNLSYCKLSQDSLLYNYKNNRENFRYIIQIIYKRGMNYERFWRT